MSMKRKNRRKLLFRLRQFFVERGFISAKSKDFKGLVKSPDFANFPDKDKVLEILEGVELNRTAKVKKQAQRSLHNKIISGNDPFNKFYKSYEWRKLRYETLLKYGRKCMCCGISSGVMHVDHIKPLRKYWHLRLDPKNVQVLCEECNHGKGNWDQTDHRPRELIEIEEEIDARLSAIREQLKPRE